RILVLAAQVAFLDQEVDAGRMGARDAPLVERDRMRVLLQTEQQLFFTLALRLLGPHGHRDAQQQHHDGDGDQQGGHRVASLVLTLALQPFGYPYRSYASTASRPSRSRPCARVALAGAAPDGL